MRDLSNLRIYRLAVDIGEAIWAVVQHWDAFERWILGKQLVDSADGISANMIEGYYRIDVTREILEKYLVDLAGYLKLKIYGDPIIFSPSTGMGKVENAGFDAFVTG